jgi:hypothetical protein
VRMDCGIHGSFPKLSHDRNIRGRVMKSGSI